MPVQLHSYDEGDLVRLKEGGPVMSIRFTVGHLLLCAWVDSTGRTRRATYSVEQLDLVHTEPPIWMTVAQRLSTRWPIVAVCECQEVAFASHLAASGQV